jgi:ATP-dependent DNA helicase RecG
VCAFANDIDNWGGGYIILGVEEKNGMPVLPPNGICKESVDAVNKELLNVCNLIEGRYVPVVSHEVYDGADILVL